MIVWVITICFAGHAFVHVSGLNFCPELRVIRRQGSSFADAQIMGNYRL